MLKIQQHFGAKITTNIDENKYAQYVVFLNKKAKRDLKVLLFNKIKNLVGTNIWTNENIDYIVVLLNTKQKNLIKNDSIISFLGLVNIDLKQLGLLLKGNFSN